MNFKQDDASFISTSKEYLVVFKKQQTTTKHVNLCALIASAATGS